jgi:transcriptional regulator with XRE-family HTH domain
MQKVGSYLKEKRLESGVTQKQLAELFGLSSSQYISNVELGKCRPALLKLDIWCEAVNANPNTVFKCFMSEYSNNVRTGLGMNP